MSNTGFTNKEQTTQKADSLHQQGRELFNDGKIAERRECTLQAMEIRKNLLGEVSEDYINSLNDYALSFNAEKKWQKAKEVQEQVMALCQKLKRPHKNIGMFTMNMGYLYYMCGDMMSAAQMWEQALPLVEKHSKDYEYLLNSLSFIYDKSNNKKGFSRIMAMIQEHNQHELTKPCDEPKCMLERAQYYGTTGNQTKAKEWYLKALNMPMDDETKAQAHEAYASYLGGTARDFATGAEYYLSAANIRKKAFGENEAYANLMYKAGMYAFMGKKYKQSVNAYLSATDFYKRQNSNEAKKNIAQCMKGMGNAYSGMKDYAMARNCYIEVKNYYEQYDQSNEEYPKAILQIANAEKYNNEYFYSINHYKRAMALFDERGMTNDYADAAALLQLCYIYAGITETVNMKHVESHEARMAKTDKLIKEVLDSLEMTNKYLGKLSYAQSLATLGGCYEMKKDYENSVNYYQQYIKVIREATRDLFRFQSEAERLIVWSNEKECIARMLELLIELPDNLSAQTKLISCVAYDAILLSKGILLNSSIEFGKVLTAKGDVYLKEKYEQAKKNDAEIERLRRAMLKDENLEMILRLEQQNRTLLLELFRGCAEYADFTKYISYTWTDVQEALLSTDVAIEFAIVGSSIFTENNQLVALVLTKDNEQPITVRVCDINKLEEVGADDDIFGKADVGMTIWGAFEKYLIGKKRVFFSADGTLNRIAIEYLQYKDIPLSEQFEVYRLSSTKELCYKRERIMPSKAALFGDINYNDETTISEATQRSLATRRYHLNADSLVNLNNTQCEINGINNILKANGVKHVQLFQNTEASKAAFIGLSDSKVNLLHIATHGIYQEEKETTEAESMQNSRLAFAGANLDDNAMVTAADIANMNLRQCDLAVLSACETGLGKLGDDGVFGLQRGFKNAGVHSLIMSLKKVHDESTANLMISFYQHLMNGASKREALVKAQQDIRDKGFDDPKYWAAFILLDGVE